MKIKVNHLGIIQDAAELDIKPLTLLVGPNNSGKTWLAYTLASIFSRIGQDEYTNGERSETVAKLYPPIVNAFTDIFTAGSAKIDLVDFARAYGEQYFYDVAQHAREWLAECMGTRSSIFDNLELSIKFTEDEKARFLEQVQASSQRGTIGNHGMGKQHLISTRKQKGEKELYVYTWSEEPIQDTLPREVIEGRLAQIILRTLHKSLYKDILVLPTERTTFITLRITQIPKQEIDEQDMAKQKIKPMSRLIGGSLTFMFMISNINSNHKEEREKDEENTIYIKRYQELSHILEQDILEGTIDVSTPEPDPERDIVFRPQGSLQPLEISLTSSMVKELSPLVFYLRYFAEPGDLLVIDEPEMNLHPRAQVQMIEFLAMLVNANIHVLITTHSPYMRDHLINLMKAAEHQDQHAISSRFYLHDSEAFIPEEKVSVYLMDHGTVKDELHNDDNEPDTFGNVSDRISEIYFGL